MKGSISNEFKKKAAHRLRIIGGVVESLEKMIDDERYCVDVMVQSAAIQESLKAFDAYLLENHIRVHIASMTKSGNIDQAVKELVRIYKLKNK